MDAAERRKLQADLTALADGDRSAFSSVFEVTQPLVARVAARMLGAGPDAEDAAQDALIKVFERASEFDPERPALPWILGVAAWECRTSRRRAGRRRSEPTPADVIDARSGDTPDPEQEALRAEAADILEEAMGALSDSDRRTLEAALGRAPRPGVPSATFRKRLQRATARLRLAWTDAHDR